MIVMAIFLLIETSINHGVVDHCGHFVICKALRPHLGVVRAVGAEQASGAEPSVRIIVIVIIIIGPTFRIILGPRIASDGFLKCAP